MARDAPQFMHSHGQGVVAPGYGWRGRNPSCARRTSTSLESLRFTIEDAEIEPIRLPNPHNRRLPVVPSAAPVPLQSIPAHLLQFGHGFVVKDVRDHFARPGVDEQAHLGGST
jgi:hypothetical protein